MATGDSSQLAKLLSGTSAATPVVQRRPVASSAAGLTFLAATATQPPTSLPTLSPHQLMVATAASVAAASMSTPTTVPSVAAAGTSTPTTVPSGERGYQSN